MPELLAPAGSLKALKAAAEAGADAVYLAGQKFGARHYADNFNSTEMEEALNYAHLRGLKVYITVNTLQKDNELAEVADYLCWLYEKGANGVIVQDLGVAGLARDLVPKLPLHASTQMTIHNQEGVKWAADFGFKRVILAREMKLAEIKKISRDILERVELEVFIHGALCYSYSGQCLFSSLIGGRSGNRGMCAQPCRKPYQLVTGKRDQYGKPRELSEVPLEGDYLLSTMDLSIYPYLEELVNSPLSSLKIEGRMRSPEYVALVVNAYHEALKSIGDWKPQKRDIENLKLAFNRGFTRGPILEATPGSTMERRSPGNRGLYLGRITHWDPVSHMATLKLESSNHPEQGDGLVFTTRAGEKVGGMALHHSPIQNQGQVIIKSSRMVQPGYKVFMTRKDSLHKWASSFIKNSLQPIIKLDLQLKWNDEHRPIITGQITAADGEIIPITYQAIFTMEPAQKRPLSEAQIRKHLQKTGGTIYTIRTLEIHYPGGLFCPLSRLNSLRRDFLDEVERMLINRHRPDSLELGTIHHNLERIKEELKLNLQVPLPPSTPDVVVWISDLESLARALDGDCKRVYLQAPMNLKSKKGARKLLKFMENAINMVDDSETQLIWKWPLITPHNILKNLNTILDELVELGLSGVMVDGLGAAEAVNIQERPLKLYGSTGLNIWNHRAMQELVGTFQGLTISPELSRDDLKKLTRLKRSRRLCAELEMMVQGNLEVLISQDTLGPAEKTLNYDNNVFWGIRDKKNHTFPVRWDPEGRTQIFNSVELCLIHHLPSIMKMGWEGLVIDARGKPATYTQEMLQMYQDALQLSLSKPSGLTSKLRSLREEVKKRSTGGITSGNFLRGLVN
jgi:putative protease